MASYVENANRVKNANDAIKQAIISKGVTPKGNLESYAEAISQISTSGGGTDVSDTTAIEENVLHGKVFHKADGSRAEGSMADNGAVSKTLDATTTSYTVPEGYHNGKGTVSVATQTKNVTPTSSEQTVYPDAGFLLSTVTVGASASSNVASGTFTTSTSFVKTDLPFMPSRVAVMSYKKSGSNDLVQCDMYVNDLRNSYGARGSSASAGGSMSGSIIVSSNGFSHKAMNTNFANMTAYYIAIEQER